MSALIFIVPSMCDRGSTSMKIPTTWLPKEDLNNYNNNRHLNVVIYLQVMSYRLSRLNLYI